MSFGTHGAAAIPDRLSVDYAPTGRASCKSCGAVIAQNTCTVRVGEKVRSPWHDGFEPLTLRTTTSAAHASR